MTTTPHVLATGSFTQDWSNAALIGVGDPNTLPNTPSISVFSAVTGASGVIPSTVTGESVSGSAGTTFAAVNGSGTTYFANGTDVQTNASAGGVFEFDQTLDTIAFQGSGTASAPNIVIALDASGRSNVVVAFTARDIDAGNSVNQAVAVQYRVGGTGAWTTVNPTVAGTGSLSVNGTPATSPDVFVSGTGATLVTQISATLPAAVDGQASLQVRVLTRDATGADELIGIDNIVVSSTPVGQVLPNVTIAATDATATEGAAGDTVAFTLSRDGDITQALTVNYTVAAAVADGATPGTDFADTQATPGTATFAAGSATATITFAPVDDLADEPSPEGFTVAVTDGADYNLGATATANGFIVDNDVPTTPVLTISPPTITQNEGNTGATTYTFTVNRDGPTTGAVDVTYAVAGSGTAPASGADFVGGAFPTATVTVPAGSATATFDIQVAADALLEPTETFTVTLSNPTGGATLGTQTAAIGTIANDDFTPIYEIQGASHFSALNGQAVTTQGIVTARFSNGFTIQDAIGDNNVNTSDGVFVFTGAAPAATIAIGAAVTVSGTVVEFRAAGAARANDLTLTEITAPTVTVGTLDNALPAATVLGAGMGERLPPLVSLGDDDVSGVFDPATQGTDFYESLEGMRVTIQDTVTSGPFRSNFGEVVVRYDVGANPSLNSRGSLTISDTTPGTVQPADKVFDLNPERIQLDDRAGGTTPTPTASGDFIGDVTGVISYEFGSYDLNSTANVSIVTPSTLERETTTIVENFDRVRVASFNVENLAPVGQPVDGQPTLASKLVGLARAIIDNLLSPEILALQEVLDNDGATNSMVTSASNTLSQLIQTIVDEGGRLYTAIDSQPIDDTVGGIPGGNQRVAYLYDATAVTPTARNNLTEVTGTPAGVTVLEAPTASQIGQGDPDFTATRKSLPIEWAPAGYTDAQGGTFFTVNSHLSSKGGSAPLFGSLLELPLYADPLNGSSQSTVSDPGEREGQAELINSFVDGVLTNASATDDRIVALGDFNDFQFFPVIDLITGQLVRTQANPDGTPSVFAPGTAVLAELEEKLPAVERYSFSFDGNAQALDHILVSNALYDSTDIDIVHMNSEFAQQVSDHDPSVASLFLARSAAIATAGNDTFDQAAYTAKFGSRGSLAGNDSIDGLGGNDTIAAGMGNDTVNGGADTDTAVFSGLRSDYTVISLDPATFRVTDNRAVGDGIDLVSNVEVFDFADRDIAAANLTDTVAPTLAASSPVDNATGVASGANIVLTFSEAVRAGSGNIVISNGAGDSRTIAIGDPQVTFNGNTITIDPTLNLAAGSAYDVTVPSGAIIDAAGNAFAGILQDQLDFTVENAPVANYKLQILHASDFEASLAAIDDAPRFAAVVDRLEDLEANSITLASGDNYLPSPFFNAAGDPALDPFFEESIGRADIRVLNTIGIEASVIGNHEFDAGPREFQNLIRPAGAGTDGGGAYEGTLFPYLASNLNFSAEPDLAPNFSATPITETGMTSNPFGGGASGGRRLASSSIIEENGQLVGVVGVTTPVFQDITTAGRVTVIGPRTLTTDADFQALAAVVQPEIDELVAAGVNKIVIVSQLQDFANEQRLITFLRDVDVVIAGGSNTLLTNAGDVLRPGDTSEGEYGQIITNAGGTQTVLVNTDGNYKYVGRLVVEFDANGLIVPASIDAANTGAYATDQAGVDRVYAGSGIDPFADGSKGDTVRDLTTVIDGVISVKDGVQFGRTDVYLEGRRGEVRSEETNLGNLSADANLFVGKQLDASVLISIKNGGGIRDSIGSIGSAGAGDELPPAANPEAGKEQGEISQLDIENSLRFNNSLSLLTLTPAQLLEALENGVSSPGNIFAQVGGLKFSYDLTRPVGDRVRTVALIDESGRVTRSVVENGDVIAGAPTAIRMTTLSFLIGSQITSGANAGQFNRPDGFRFGEYAAADPAFANRVDLDGDASGTDDVAARTGAATFTDNGREQDALAEYLAARFSQTPFAQADTTQAGDTRIQNLGVRGDNVLPNAVPGTGASETLTATSGDDNVDAGGGDDDVFAGAGNDTVSGGSGDDLIVGEAGNDMLVGGNGDDTVEGGSGDDVVAGETGDDALFGGEGADTLVGGTGDDVAFGGIGNDIVAGQAGDDVIGGEDGDDVLIGETGDDTLFGGEGRDVLYGGDGNDLLAGQNGNDLLAGQAGDDSLSGEDGDDSLSGENGNDQLFGGAGNDTLFGGAGNDSLAGQAGNDVVAGQDGDDVVRGEDGDDLVLGEAGNDILFGGAGNDVLAGGLGDDIFVFALSGGMDRIVDFVGIDDLIQISGFAGVNNFESAMALATDTNGGTLFAFNQADTLFLEGLAKNSFAADDFSFA